MKHCTTDKCPQILDSSCVFYEGTTLLFSGINTNDSVEVVIQKLNLRLESIPEINLDNYYNKQEINNIIKEYIPLSGTLLNYPVIGNIEFSPGKNIKLYSNDSSIMLDDGSVNINGDYITISSINNNSVLINNDQVFLNSGNSNNRKFINLSQELNYIPLQSNTDGAGLVGQNYYGNNYVDNSFVQKKFVIDTFNNIDLSNYYTKTETNLLLENYYLKTETFSQTEINNLLNNKQNNLGYTPENIANKSDSYTISSSTTYASTKALVDGLATKLDSEKFSPLSPNYLPFLHGSDHFFDSPFYVDTTNGYFVGLNKTNPTEYLDVNGNVKANGFKKEGGTANQSLTADGGVFDLNNLVPYDNAIKDVNIGANYFQTSKGFDFTFDAYNYFNTYQSDYYSTLEFKSKDSSDDNFGYLQITANAEEGFNVDCVDGNGANANSLQVNINGTSSPKAFVSGVGFKTPFGTSNQALTANGDVFDLNTKADLVGGKIPASQLPAYVDDVLEFANLASFPATGESCKIYIAIDTNLTYRWGGSSYVVMSSSLALGETSSTAYRGDRGKIAYDHSQTTGNPHGTTKSDVGLGNVPNLDTTNAVNNSHTHSNKSILDLITEPFTTSLKSLYDGVVTSINNLLLTGQRLITSGEIKKLSNTSGTNTGDETTSSIQTKRPLKTIEGQSLEGSGNIDLTKNDIGLGNVDNTSDLNKPISNATQTALNNKQDRLQSATGNIGVGKTDASATEKLDVNGNVKATSFIKSGGTPTQFLMADGSTNSNTYAKTDGTNATGNWGISITGNAATATKLQTARKINGVSFDGSADITINAGTNYTAGTNISISGNQISVVDSPTFAESVTASAFYESSLRELKENIQHFEKSGLELVNSLEIVTFDKKDGSAKDKIGIIADDSPEEFLSEDKCAVDLYKTVFIQSKAIQELNAKNKKLEEELQNLRELILTKLNN